MNEEQWKDIPGYEGMYQVSNFGRLKSFKGDKAGRILSNTDRKGNYLRIVLQGKGMPQKTALLHRLVATAFIPNPDGLPQVNHKDGNKQNNRVENLEWCTGSENVRHSQKMNPSQLEPMRYYNIVERPKAILQYSKSGEFLHWYPSGAEAARQTGICQRNILQSANGTPNEHGYRRKSAGGFVWRFESEVMNCEL